jgi:ribosomal protein S18 acetylase RimI-like enzyme
MNVRRPDLTEYNTIRALIRTVVAETYGHLWDTCAMSDGDEDWSKGWIAVAEADVIGVLLTSNEWVDDLWVARPARSRGLGAELLSIGEAEIAERGFETACLRLIKTNLRAISFYINHGWKIEREFQHEHLPVTMLRLEKNLGQMGR